MRIQNLYDTDDLRNLSQVSQLDLHEFYFDFEQFRRQNSQAIGGARAVPGRSPARTPFSIFIKDIEKPRMSLQGMRIVKSPC